MEQENKVESPEMNQAKEKMTSGAEEHEHSSHHVSGSHHGTHSHHGSHSHHGKRNKNKRKSLLNRVQGWLDQRFSGKTIIILCVCILVLVVCFISIIYILETKHNALPDDYQNDFIPNGTSPEGEEVSSAAVATQTKIPSYWENMIAEKTKKVKALQTAGGKDSVSFVWASDTHIPDNHMARTNDLGKLMAKMMDNCDIPFAVLTGDIGTRASYNTEAELIEKQSKIPQHLAPLWGTERLLVALGNHDGCYGDSSGYYAKQLPSERLWQFYFRNQALDSRRVFSDDGTYFYVDNVAQKTRFIVLNSQFGGEYLADGNGWAVNNRFTVSCYGQAQLDWLANVALDMPEGYGAIITAHVPPKILYSFETQPYTVDCAQLCGIIDAYNNKTTFTGSYTEGVDNWSNSTVNVDFTGAKGEIIAMFTGHVHHDSIDTATLSCPLITIISAGASVNLGEEPNRIFYTDQETNFDVVTINRKTRTIHCTRVGAGEDRVIPY